MLVDVVRLRSKGARLPADEVKTARALRGNLSVMSRSTRSAPSGKALMAFLLDPVSQISELLPALDDVRLTALRGNEFVLQGREEVSAGMRRFDLHAQSWWCRLVLPAGGGSVTLDWAEDDAADLGALPVDFSR